MVGSLQVGHLGAGLGEAGLAFDQEAINKEGFASRALFAERCQRQSFSVLLRSETVRILQPCALFSNILSSAISGTFFAIAVSRI